MILFGIRTKISYKTLFFLERLLATEMKTQISINKTAYLGLSILEISKIVK